ncbi:MAG: hypothetical protein M3506_00420 [Chloroflexota bacterium]|nr:hypothetical protein [Chloroflexota bacterium]
MTTDTMRIDLFEEVVNALCAANVPAPDDELENAEYLHLGYWSQSDAVEAHKAAYDAGLPLDEVTSSPWEQADNGMYYVTFVQEEAS